MPYDQDLPEHVVRLYPKGRRIYNTPEGYEIAVVCAPGKNPAAIVMAQSKDHLPPGIYNLAARSILSQAPLLTNLSKRNYFTARVGVSILKKTTVDEASKPNGKYPNPTYTTLQLFCFCLKTIDRNEHYVECQKCSLPFHSYCCGAYKSDQIPYTCPTCYLDVFRGACWGAPLPNVVPAKKTLSNTCSIDNYLTLFGLVEKEGLTDRSFAQLFNGPTANQQTFTQCVLLAAQNNFCQAQQQWASALGLTNLLGSQEEMITEKLANANTFTRVMQCSTPSCPTRRQVVNIFDFSNKEQDPEVALTEVLNPKTSITCPYCQYGVSKQTSLENEDPANPSPYFEINNVARGFSYEECLQMPDQINIGKAFYKKKMITIITKPDVADTSAVGHFTAAIQYWGKWLFYNGMSAPKDRLLPIHPRDYGKPQDAINTVVYTYISTSP
jgi:hypothetical protein